MGIVAKTADIVDTVSRSSTGPKTRSTDIDGISTMVDGSDATFQILRRG